MKRIAELDSLRGLAAIAIMLYQPIPWRLPFGWVFVEMTATLSREFFERPMRSFKSRFEESQAARPEQKSEPVIVGGSKISP